MQFQLATLPPSLSHQLKWGRFINTHGGLGKNIPCDLFNKHMNKLFKEIIQNMGPNMTENAIKRAARSVTASVVTTAHTTRTDEEDVAKVVSVLMKNRSLSVTPGRKLSQFKQFSMNPLNNLKWDQMKTWIRRKKSELLSYKCAVGEGNMSDSDATDCSDTDSDSDD